MPYVPDSATRFSSRVADYIAHRPSYPSAALTHLTTVFSHLPADGVIADIGSGTGILSAQLLADPALAAKRIRVVGIEPNADMRAAAASQLAPDIASGRFATHDGSAEATRLDDHSVDLVVAAQAFHWFDVPRARAECMRILKGDGAAGVALLWNDRRGVHGAGTAGAEAARREERKSNGGAFPRLDAPVMDAYDLLLVERAPGYAEVDHQHTVTEESLREFFGPEGYRLETFENPYRLDFEQLRGRLLSSSYTPREGEEGYEEMIGELKELFDRFQRDGKVDFMYDARVFTGVMS